MKYNTTLASSCAFLKGNKTIISWEAQKMKVFTKNAYHIYCLHDLS